MGPRGGASPLRISSSPSTETPPESRKTERQNEFNLLKEELSYGKGHLTENYQPTSIHRTELSHSHVNIWLTYND